MRAFVLLILVTATLSGCLSSEAPDSSDGLDGQDSGADGASPKGSGSGSDEPGKPGEPGEPGQSGVAGCCAWVEVEQRNLVIVDGKLVEGSLDFDIENGTYGVQFEPSTGVFVDSGITWGECTKATSMSGTHILVAGAVLALGGSTSRGKITECGAFEAGSHTLELEFDTANGHALLALYRHDS